MTEETTTSNDADRRTAEEFIKKIPIGHSEVFEMTDRRWDNLVWRDFRENRDRYEVVTIPAVD